MFEKDAEKYGKENYVIQNNGLCTFVDSERTSKIWKDGAEFGYNKANEWQFVKDGVYPTDDKKVLCILGDFENDNLEVGYYSQVEGDSKRWRFEDYDLPDDSEEGWGVSAWKEIVLPKEEKDVD